MTPFSEQIIQLIQSIPLGKVATYGQIAAIAGNHRAARQVSRILHTCTKKYNLPWHRVVNSQGKISLTHSGYQLQFDLLHQEGIEFGLRAKIDFELYLFSF